MREDDPEAEADESMDDFPEDLFPDELDPTKDEPNAMSFLEHMEEFRWTVARSLLAFVLGVVVVVVLMPKIGGFLQMPLIQAYGSPDLVAQKLITYKPMGVFSVFIPVSYTHLTLPTKA